MPSSSSDGNPAAPSPSAALADNGLTCRAIVCALFLGTGVCLTNMYFGLQAGMVNAMPMQSALLGFALLQLFKAHFSTALTPQEITLIEVIAGALGLAPFTSGLTSFIPALQFLVDSDRDAGARFTTSQLLVWSLSTCGLGIVIGASFRRLFIIQERLRFPSATATGTLIGVLFDRKDTAAQANPSARPVPDQASGDTQVTPSNGFQGHDCGTTSVICHDYDQNSVIQDHHRSNITILLFSLVGSVIFGIVSFFAPVLHRLPLFGNDIAEKWLWSFDLSPAYLGYGIIIGPAINTYTLLGAIVGWGILSPIAKRNGWAPGSVGEFDNGARGWILCVGMGLVLGDTFVSLTWIVIRLIGNPIKATLLSRKRPLANQPQEQVSLLSNSSAVHDNLQEGNDGLSLQQWSNSSLVTPPLILWHGSTIFLLFLASLLLAFRHTVSAFAIPITALMMPLAALISIRSLGETDNGASLAIGRLSQIINALVMPTSSPMFTSTNLLMSGATESVASQASQHMGGLRTAYMTNTAPRVVLHAQMLGSYVGSVVAVSLYTIYTSINKIPSQDFGIPDARLYIVTIQMIRQQGLPPKAMEFAWVAFIIGAICGGLRIVGKDHWWRCLVPSGVAMAVGMYIPPAITLPRAIGGLIPIIAQRRDNVTSFTMMCCATGLILGQGLCSLVGLSLDALHV
ncbi:oligopeptide transporter [Fusarium agapanthi]|uniref:Oligopeptide transporter n=1 Tax=Fusarium agapanthi TaxID=1803897 RepID=A0A9P5B0R8_9HYPO|nr:oligopeptide transporter [Fusarium agapanthi]